MIYYPSLLICLFSDPIDSQWRTIFGQLQVEITYLAMPNVSIAADIYQQIRSINTKVVILLAKTTQIESYILHSQELVESNNLTWVVYSKDTLPFKCEDCISVNMYWVRTLSAGTITDLRRLADFITLEELDIGMNYKIHTYEELWASACIDAMKISFLFILTQNETLQDLVPDTIKKQILAVPENRTINDILRYSSLQYEYGNYTYYYQSYYYQVSLV